MRKKFEVLLLLQIQNIGHNEHSKDTLSCSQYTVTFPVHCHVPSTLSRSQYTVTFPVHCHIPSTQYIYTCTCREWEMQTVQYMVAGKMQTCLTRMTSIGPSIASSSFFCILSVRKDRREHSHMHTTCVFCQYVRTGGNIHTCTPRVYSAST